MMSLPAIRSFRVVFACLALAALAACAGPATREPRPLGSPEPPTAATVARYQAVQDGPYTIPAVNPGYLTGNNARVEVRYIGPEAPGTIVVDPYVRVLYYVKEGGFATRYGIAVGRAGYAFRGSATIGRKAEWPGWTPTRNMVRREPHIYGPVAGGLPGGLENPLGARALYLYRGARDTMYRIHGTNNTSTIGRATSAGCIRLFNQDIIHLFEQVPMGAPVHVRSAAESAVAEDPMVENASGLMVRLDSFPPEVQAQILAGNPPWPKFQPQIGISASEPASAPDDPGA